MFKYEELTVPASEVRAQGSDWNEGDLFSTGLSDALILTVDRGDYVDGDEEFDDWLGEFGVDAPQGFRIRVMLPNGRVEDVYRQYWQPVTVLRPVPYEGPGR